jgi:histidyl-tRNA synthetase
MAGLIKAVRGTRDLLPPETETWNFVEAAVRDIFRVYNFQEIRTPIIEDLRLFQRSVGEDTDIVSKEMFTWREGSASDRQLERAWTAQYKDMYTSVEFEPRLGKQERIDVVAHIGGIPHLVELRWQVDLRGISFLRNIGKVWRNVHPDSKLPKLVLAAPASEINKFAAYNFSDVDFQPLNIDMQELELSQSLALRPENTAGVVRAYIEHNLSERPGLQRFYYIGPQFRRERPQKGRYRQFYQIGAEVIGPSAAGSESPAVDAELLEMLASLLDRLGIQGWSLKLNSVGCASDRPIYLQALRDALKDVVHTMCSDCQRRAETNPLRVLDCKVPADQPIIETLPRMADYLDESCRTHFAEVQKLLTAMEVPFIIDHRLVRGLDYYTRTAFEFTHGALGAQNAILGGGRYDGLSESLGGPPAPGIGFAIGEDRLVMTLQESAGVKALPADVYIAPLGAGMNLHAAKLARELRRQGVVVIAGDESFKLKKSLETASKLGVRFALILGENEVNSGQYALKNLSTGEQAGMSKEQIAGVVKQEK